MTDEQVEQYAGDYGLERAGNGRVMAKTIVEDVRSYVLCAVQNSPAFLEGADVSIKR